MPLLTLLAPGVGMGGGGAATAADDPGFTWRELDRPTTWIEIDRPTTTIVGRGMQIRKRPGETRLHCISFAELAEIAGGDTIASVTSITAIPYQTSRSDSTPLTFGSSTIGNAVDEDGAVVAVSGAVRFDIAAGTEDMRYLVEVTVVTTAGKTLVGEIDVLVTRKPGGIVT